jgi:hypothetical protein
MSIRGGTGIPGSSGERSVSSSAHHPAAAALSCNLCSKPLATTCFLCACDCIFCEGEFLVGWFGEFVWAIKQLCIG